VCLDVDGWSASNADRRHIFISPPQPGKIRQCNVGVLAAEQWPDERGMRTLAQPEIAGVQHHT
jgi:hypothetical protein